MRFGFYSEGKQAACTLLPHCRLKIVMYNTSLWCVVPSVSNPALYPTAPVLVYPAITVPGGKQTVTNYPT